MKLLVIDGNSILNRAFYGIKLLTTKNGEYTNGIYGFLSILLKITEDTSPDHVAIAFDLRAPTFRHKRYAGYKATRKGMPEELAAQVGPLKELLRALGYTLVEQEGFEADDILGTLGRCCREAGGECVIATGDRDALQLVGGGVTVRLATTKMGRPEAVVYDEDAVREKYGVSPQQLIDVKALMGDSSDNIPGVAGVGEKTAIALIAKFGSLDGVYGNLDDPEIKAGVRAKLENGRESARMSRELAEICLTAPVDTDLEHYLPRPADRQAAAALLARLEMFKMIDRLGLSGEEIPTAQAQEDSGPVLQEAGLSQLLKSGDPLCLVCAWEGDVPLRAAASGEKVCFLSRDPGELQEQLAGLCRAPAGLRVDRSKPLYRWARPRGLEPTVSFDAELAGYLLNPGASGYGPERLALENAASRRAFCPAPEGMEDIAETLSWLAGAAPAVERKIEENGQTPLLRDVEIPLAEVLADMELTGFALDRDSLAQFGEGLDGDIARLQDEVWQEAGEQFNIASPKQMGDILFGKLQLPAGKKTKSGYSTNADVLERLRDKHPIVDKILEYRKLTKLKSTYVEAFLKLIGPDGRIHTSFNQTETRTGRISSLEPNMQNIPVRTELGSNMRRFFTARPGCVLVDADYSQIELRVLSHMAGDQNMQEAFLTGEDIHTNTAAQVFGLPPLYVTPLMRSRAKAVNFGIVYGISAFSLAQDIGVSVAEADSYIKDYLKTFSGVKRYMEDSVAYGKEHGYVATLFGRRRYLPELASSNHNLRSFGERVAMNMPIQGTAADIIKIAMVRVHRELERSGLDARLILQVHDELIVESAEKDGPAVCELLRREMEGAAQLAVPLTVDVGMGKTWYEAK
ncbi:MAG: DNA polymerase I [Oscillospiraceae bacterium]|nr:DNA polymerase I [Oscillospiraceae bacterium]